MGLLEDIVAKEPTGHITKDGYKTIFKPKHPNSNKTGRIFEHRFVMSEYLGRALFEGENVHHKNGVRNDNRIENLELWVVSQPYGQRPQDLVIWAKEILRRYDNQEDGNDTFERH